MGPVQPGTYRIVSVASSTCIISHGNWNAVCWRKLDNKNQQWYVQRSGEGYRIKNCSTGLYLVISDAGVHAKVCCGRYPTTWELNQGMKDHDMYTIKYPDCDRVVDLHEGAGHDGNELHMHPQGGWLACKRWRFERLSDDTGEEEQKLIQELQSKSKQIDEKDRRIQEQNAQLTERNCSLAEKDQQLAEQGSQLVQMKERLATQEGEFNRVTLDLAQKSALLLQTQDALRLAGESLVAHGNESLRAEVQRVIDRLEYETKRAEKLQERLESLEQMLAENF
ncbi:hypothetical protein FRC08_009438 [Ceratobasidium sp. 394]|nr:hypothetical protein FRC08_009438 [Ceratobasidium sp. 394]